jgi:hypothetical protein
MIPQLAVNVSRIPSPRLVAALYEMGFRVAIVTSSGETINPAIGIWGRRDHWCPQWALSDQAFPAFAAGGFETLIFKWGWIPPHGTIEGKCSYREYTLGVSPWLLDENGDALVPGRNALDVTLPWAADPANVDPKWVAKLSARIEERYADDAVLKKPVPYVVNTVIDLNECDDGNYWISISTRSQDEAFDRWFSQVIRPATTVRKRMETWGPEMAGLDGLRRGLEKTRIVQVFSGAPTFHAYAPPDDNTLARALHELALRRDVIKNFTAFRSNVIAGRLTEIGDGGAGYIVDYIKQAPSVFPELELVTVLHDDTSPNSPWFKPGTTVRIDGVIDGDGSYQLTAQGEELKAYMAEQRRRAVKS